MNYDKTTIAKTQYRYNHVGDSVESCVNRTVQPGNGYLDPNKFTHVVFKPKPRFKNHKMSISVSVIEKSIKYLISKDFPKITNHLVNANGLRVNVRDDYVVENMQNLQQNIKLGLDDESIKNAFKLVIIQDNLLNNPRTVITNLKTKKIPKSSINCVINFINAAGEITNAFINNYNNFTKSITTDNYDPAKYLTDDAFYLTIASNEEVFDQKVTLKLLIYYIMGLHGYDNADFKRLQYLSVYDFYTNSVYQIAIKNIDQRIINTVSNDVIGYDSALNCTDRMGTQNISIKDRIKAIKQPLGGFLEPKYFIQDELHFDSYVFTDETIDSRIIDVAVNYLTKVKLTKHMYMQSFDNIIYPSTINAKMMDIAENNLSDRNEMQIHNLDFLLSHESYSRYQDLKSANAVIAAIKIAKYCAFDSSPDLFGKLPVWANIDDIPNNTIANVETIVNRILHLFRINNPLIDFDIDLTNLSTGIIRYGKCEYVTRTAIWIIIDGTYRKLNQNLTLELLVTYLMGLHIYNNLFKSIKYLGIYNYRTDIMYRLEISKIDPDIIDEVATSIIGYDK